MQTLAHRAYGQIKHRTAGNKDVEYALFQDITQALQAVDAAEAPQPTIWADAISRNLQLWSALATDLLNSGNQLPQALRAQILSLCEFVRRTSMSVLAGEPGLGDLIEVNETIMLGMRPSCSATDGGAA